MEVGGVVFVDDKTRHSTLSFARHRQSEISGVQGPGKDDCKMDARTCQITILNSQIYLEGVVGQSRQIIWGLLKIRE